MIFSCFLFGVCWWCFCSFGVYLVVQIESQSLICWEMGVSCWFYGFCVVVFERLVWFGVIGVRRVWALSLFV